MAKTRFGILSTAAIGLQKVIPAMQQGLRTEVVAIASRDAGRAREAAAALGIPRAHDSYDALLADPDVDAIYNPLPNHLHVDWSIAAADHGKHVLCEKPIGLTAGDCEDLIAARDRTGVKMQEAFMVWSHPQWMRARQICQSGRLGDVRAYLGAFSYYNDDPANIRNVAAWGGGGLMDIGCYLLVTSRFVFGEEPRRVLALMARDEATGVDVLTSVVLDFPSGQAVGTCSTRLVPYQRVQIFGTRGRLDVEIPFNAPPDRPCRLFVDDGRDVFGSGVETIEIPTVDQYTVQGDLFAKAIQEDAEVVYPLEMSLRNMRAIDALFQSADTGGWVALETEPRLVL